MDGNKDYYTDWSKSQKDKWYHLYVELEKYYKWIYIHNRNKLTDIEKRLLVAKVDGERERTGLEVWDYQMQTIIYRMDKQQVPIDSTGNYI